MRKLCTIGHGIMIYECLPRYYCNAYGITLCFADIMGNLTKGFYVYKKMGLSYFPWQAIM